MKKSQIAFIVGFGLSHVLVPAQADFHRDSDVQELAEMSLEDFSELDVIVTSVSRKAQKISDTSAAVFVISSEDIKRSGVTSIPEALRMVPGMQVAQIDANKWAISSRGFNGRFANKLLVLIDGRTVYNPMFSGVFWNRQTIMMEDVDRIEVIRGPGASLWGANAVNGVINVISKPASATRGGLVTLGTGTEEQGFTSLRYGAQLNETADLRAYVQYFDKDSGENIDGSQGLDGWDNTQGGFRLDWQPNSSNNLTLQGDLQDTVIGNERTTPSLTAPFSVTAKTVVDINAWNVLGRWKHRVSESSDFELQLYYDSHERKQTGDLNQLYETLDVDFQHRFALWQRQEILWGLGYRHVNDEFAGDFTITLDPAEDTTELFSFFIQDEISLLDDRVHLIIGSKFEHNDYTGWEVQPNIRLNWTYSEQLSLWASLSKAARTPARTTDIRINQFVMPGAPPRLIAILGNPDIDSEQVTAFDLGLRGQYNQRVNYDLAFFYNRYKKLSSFEALTPSLVLTPVPHILVPLTSENFLYGETYGFEAALDWKATDWITLNLAYSYLEMQLHRRSASTSTTAEDAEGESPEQQLSLRTSFNLTDRVDLDTWVRYVDALPAQNLDDYVTLDTRLAWRPRQGLELSVIGQNLLNSSQLQFKPEILSNTPTQAERGLYVKLQWEF